MGQEETEDNLGARWRTWKGAVRRSDSAIGGIRVLNG